MDYLFVDMRYMNKIKWQLYVDIPMNVIDLLSWQDLNTKTELR